MRASNTIVEVFDAANLSDLRPILARRPLMARVELIRAATAPLSTRELFADGDPGPIAASLAQVPELVDVALPFFGAALGPSSIALRPKELVILRTSALMQCRYCVAAHTPVAIDAGLDHREVGALRGAGDLAEAFTDPAELALLRWVDAVATGVGSVDDAVAPSWRRTGPITTWSSSRCWWGRRCCSTATAAPSNSPRRTRPSFGWPRRVSDDRRRRGHRGR